MFLLFFHSDSPLHQYIISVFNTSIAGLTPHRSVVEVPSAGIAESDVPVEFLIAKILDNLIHPFMVYSKLMENALL